MQAPGAPGAPPAWGPGRKQAFGTAPGVASKVWFTLASGNLSEVFFPRVDRPALHGLRFLIAAPGGEPIDDAFEADHNLSWLRSGVPAFSVHSTHSEYSLTKEFVSDPALSGLLIAGQFQPELPDLSLFLQASPHLVPGSPGNSALIADVEPPVLLAQQGDVWMAVVGPFSRASAGFLNSSDLFVDLYDNDGEMTAIYSRAEGGNVALGAQMGFEGGPFQMAIGFADSRTEAEDVARQVLRKGLGQLQQAFERAWLEVPDLPRQHERVSGDGGVLAQSSLTLLRCLEDKTERGAFVAAPGAPWGETQHDGDHIYHLVWPRDLCHMATALVDAGDAEAGLRALRYLERIQRPDGSWPQNCTVDGVAHWTGCELDQLAYPILLAWRLGMANALDHDVYNALVRAAASCIVAQGPATPLDRWEDAGGLSPSTIGACIAALVASEEFAYDAGDHLAAAHLRAVADYWSDQLENWCFNAENRHYVRIARDPNAGPQASDPLGVEFLELVRRGLRAPEHPCVLRSLEQADAVLRVQTPRGVAWRRYTGDCYGEYPDGSPWNGDGQGRAWPLLTAERARHLLALGRPVGELLKAMESFAGADLGLPEQVWDAEPIPEHGLVPGGPTNSASPLGWAHAEYLKLLATISAGKSADVVEPAWRRYVEGRPAAPAFIWSHAHQIKHFLAGRGVKIQLPEQALVTWTADHWATFKEVEAGDTNLGVWVAELPTQIMRPGASMEWTAEYRDQWEGRNYALLCRPNLAPVSGK